MTTSSLETKKVHIKDAKPNMILAKDAITDEGIVVIAKNTMLSDVNYKKLKNKGINYITIFSRSTIDENEFNEEIQEDNNSYVRIEDRKEFKLFEKVYIDKIEKLENQFIAIGKGVGVEIENLYSIVIDTLNVVNCKSDIFFYLNHLKNQHIHTYAHCLNVGIICNLFGLWLGFDGEKLKNITVAGVLHDIGKTKIETELIQKPGKLTKEEFENVKKHVYLGYKLIENLDLPNEIKEGVLMHHEKIDGSGYPLGLKDEKIALTGKIIAICDIYEAMTSDRVYRPRVCPFNVIKNFEQNSYDILDTTLLLAFLQNIAYTYVGSRVILSTDEEAEVVFINQAHLSKPIVRTDTGFIDLSKEKDIDIKCIL